MLSLPANVYGNILRQLNNVITDDIQHMMKDACNLACTSKSIAEKIHDLEAVRPFLISLSEKYHFTPLHFATVLNTKGAQNWMLEHIKEMGKYRQVPTIQAIYALTAEVIKEAKIATLESSQNITQS